MNLHKLDQVVERERIIVDRVIRRSLAFANAQQFEIYVQAHFLEFDANANQRFTELAAVLGDPVWCTSDSLCLTMRGYSFRRVYEAEALACHKKLGGRL